MSDGGAPIVSRAEAAAFDRAAIDAGVPGIVLMENAGRGATDAIVARMGAHLERVVCVGGPGNNGGDAWVVARQLRTRGHERVRALLVGRRDALEGDAALAARAYEAVGGRIESVAPGPLEVEGATLFVDGLFGTGLTRPIEGGHAEVLRSMVGAPVVALDLPSGVDADTGQVLGTAPQAALTVTFGALKRGLTQAPGRALAGEVVVADIGVPDAASHPTTCIRLVDVARWVPRRRAHAHKGSAGHVLVVGGSAGKTGAAILASWGALRGGAGLVTIASSAHAAVDGKVVEVMSRPLASPAEVLTQVESLHAAVLGPGLGLDDAALALVREVGFEASAPLVLDADALTLLAREGLDRVQGAGPRVLTPHPGEAARLLGTDSASVQADRYAAAAELASRSGQVVVLKGAGTIVAHPDGRMRVCLAGTPALGVAGTGDVLAGVIGALLGNGLTPFDAASAGTWLHARAGELAAVTDRGLRAREVADALPAVLQTLRTTG